MNKFITNKQKKEDELPVQKKLPVRPKRFFIILLILIAIAGIGTSVFLYIQYQKAQTILNNPGVAGQLEAKDLVKKISRLMLLPLDEEPTVATVSDYTKLKDQPFFKNAQNGNKVLIYTKAKMAILYDPKLDKILAVAPLNLGQSETPLRITLYNGTTTDGLANTIEEQLKASVTNIVIAGKENAENTYTKTLVVDLTGNQQKAAADIAALLDGETGSLPEGETAPADTDLLVIIGE